MKNVFKRVLAAVMAAVSLGTSFISVSAESESSITTSSKEFKLNYYNEDGSFNETNIDFLIDAYKSETTQMMKLWRISRNFFNSKEQNQLYDMRLLENVYPFNLKMMKELIDNRLETECVDGKYYVTVDGRKIEYYYSENEYDVPVIYYNLANYFLPTDEDTAYIRPVGAMSVSTDYDTLSYIQKYELWYKICMMQKESIIFDRIYYASDEFIDNFNNERYDEIIMNLIKNKMEGYSDVPNDANGNGMIDSEDALIIMQYALGNNYSVLADVDNDGKVTSYDALLLLQKITDGNE